MFLQHSSFTNCIGTVLLRSIDRTSQPVQHLFLGDLDAVPQTLNHKLLARGPAVDVPDVVGGALKVTAGVVALGDEDVVLGAVLVGLVQGNGRALFDNLLAGGQ